MLQNAVWCTLAGFGALCHAVQVPLASHVGPQHDGGGTGEVLGDERLLSFDKPHYAAASLHVGDDHDDALMMKWRLDDPPNVNSTAHLVFETVNSFLQHWPNTRMRNGHNIVPGTVPPGTLLYHGTWHSGLPPGPEWTATDPEHSILFCRNTNGEDGCWHLTLVTTRPLKRYHCVGKVQPDWAYEERDRIEALCEWGREYDVDGFVSEVMLCNFTSSVRVVSSLTLAKPGTSPRASRILIYLVLVSFYDTELVPSLVPARFGTERWNHRLLNISDEDVTQARARLGEVLSRPAYRSGSGIDWLALIRVVVDRYSERLELQVQLGNMLAPYILVDVTPPSTLPKTKEAGLDVLDWARPAYRLCATTHTGMLKGGAMTSSEKLLLNAVHDTTREICRVDVLAGVDQFMGTDNERDVHAIENMMKIWKKDIDELMAWLDWNAWVKCRPACGPEEMCYLTTWPVGFPMPHRPRPRQPENGDPRSPSPSQPPVGEEPIPTRPPRGGRPPHGEPAEDWERPQPRCIRRVDPYTI
ncbi:hypothetical protein BKA82DRAFT_4175242 [Pisolithus tinctorius]|nr:hypothetical protein BKA82DRAFT_4175242 [Pisolithus tinctorius]